jgi:hypothetical protein
MTRRTRRKGGKYGVGKVEELENKKRRKNKEDKINFIFYIVSILSFSSHHCLLLHGSEVGTSFSYFTMKVLPSFCIRSPMNAEVLME